MDFHSTTAPQNNIELVIDESIRGGHVSINGYERETTPFLDALSQDGSFHNWGLAVAGATCSHPSNSLILTGVRPGTDDFGNATNCPTIFQYAKAMGYTTWYMDAQTNTFWNGLTDSDVTYLDSWIKAKDLGDDIQSDFRAADKIVQIVSAGTGNFIVLNKRGVHFLCEGSYPAEAAIWGPKKRSIAASGLAIPIHRCSCDPSPGPRGLAAPGLLEVAQLGSSHLGKPTIQAAGMRLQPESTALGRSPSSTKTPRRASADG